MRKILLKVLALPLFFSALSAVEAKAVSAEELIQQKQAKAASLREFSENRVHELKNADPASVSLEGGFARGLSGMEPASGKTVAAVGDDSGNKVSIVQEPSKEEKSANKKASDSKAQPSSQTAAPAATTPKKPTGPVANEAGVI